MRKIEVYQTGDGKTFFKKEEAEGHESKLAVEARRKSIGE